MYRRRRRWRRHRGKGYNNVEEENELGMEKFEKRQKDK